MNTYDKKTYERDFPETGNFNWKTVRLKTPENPYYDEAKITGVVLHDGNFMVNGVLFLENQYEIINENPTNLIVPTNITIMKKELPKFKVEATIALPTLCDIIVTAIEGGSNYWYFIMEPEEEIILKYTNKHTDISRVVLGSVKPTFSQAILIAVLHGEKIKIYDLEEVVADPNGKHSPIGELSIESIQKGIVAFTRDFPQEIGVFMEGSDFDADMADTIFQYMCLGELIYA